MKKLLAVVLWAGCSTTPSYSGPRSKLDEAGAESARAACTFKAGDPVGVSVPKDAKLGKQIPIDNIVVLMMENRSFDAILSNLPSYGQTDVDVATTANSNPDSAGNAVQFHHLDTLCFNDTNHEWDGSHVEFDDGKNDGFVLANENYSGGGPDGSRAMGFYNETDLPFIYAAANAFAISDHYFCSALGPTFVNREFLYAGTSFGYTYNQILANPEPNLFDTLVTSKIDWHIYSETLPGPAIFLDLYSQYIGDNFYLQKYFFDDAAAGTLPPVTFLDPNLRDVGADHDDMHPPGDVQLGDALLAKVVAAMTSSPQWAHSALFITFDENGGQFDHVAPPKACPPDDTAPISQNGSPVEGAFDNYGFRVPVIVVSPYAKRHYVSHNNYDHTSILRFIEARFELGALTGRDANADPMFDLFDFSKADKSVPTLPSSTPDAQKESDCNAQFPDDGGTGIPGLNPDMM